MVSRTQLALGVIIALWYILVGMGFNRAIGNYSSLSDDVLMGFGVFVISITGVFSIIFFLNIFREIDFGREKEMRRQIELEKKKSRSPDEDEKRDWILR